ncbi:hypothetical protein DL93DRAFT_2088133, partial [Clavulina sp. PMI_390]
MSATCALIAFLNPSRMSWFFSIFVCTPQNYEVNYISLPPTILHGGAYDNTTSLGVSVHITVALSRCEEEVDRTEP